MFAATRPSTVSRQVSAHFLHVLSSSSYGSPPTDGRVFWKKKLGSRRRRDLAADAQRVRRVDAKVALEDHGGHRVVVLGEQLEERLDVTTPVGLRRIPESHIPVLDGGRGGGEEDDGAHDEWCCGIRIPHLKTFWDVN